jgi:uncharacterized membrane protein YhhN
VTGPAVALLVVAGVVAVVDWTAVARSNRRVEYVAKPLTLALLVAAAVAVDPVLADRRSWFVVALVLSLAGDVFLMLPRDLFVPGLPAFLAGHVAYVGGLRVDPPSAGALALAAVPVVAAVATIGATVVRGAARADRALVGPVVAYVAVISVMVAHALAGGVLLVAVAAVLFYASDALIASERFVSPRAWQPLAIIVTYHVAQALFVASLTTR